MMKKTRLGLLIIVGLLLTSMTVYDLLPYQVRNYITHSGSTTQSYDLVFNSTTPRIEIYMEPFIDIQDPFPDTIDTLILSSSINVSYRISSHDWTATLDSFYGYIETNTTYVFHDISYSENQNWFMFRNVNMTDISCVFSYTANYTLEMVYTRPPKTYAWATLFSLLTTEGVILMGVIFFASVIIYASIRMISDS